MKLTIDDCTATVTGDPLHITPRFDFWDFRLRIATYANVEERGRFLLDTFGSGPWLWDTPDELRFDKRSLELVGAEFEIAGEVADSEDCARLPAAPPARPGGLRADEAEQRAKIGERMRDRQARHADRMKRMQGEPRR